MYLRFSRRRLWRRLSSELKLCVACRSLLKLKMSLLPPSSPSGLRQLELLPDYEALQPIMQPTSTRNNVILSAGNVHCVLFRHLIPKVDRNRFCPARFLCDETVHERRYCWFVWRRGAEKRISKLILESERRTRCQVVSDSNSWCVLKKKVLSSGLFEDNWLTEMSRLQYDVTCLGFCVVRAILCLLIQSNWIEMQPSISILLWVSWPFDLSL
jgi:hypothetical protein